ncbi:MAG TPA: hypothetical protein VGE34_01325 [Candidatus Saccharimonadales bacterium]
MKTSINSPVLVTAMRFGRHMCAIPSRMEWEGHEYHFKGNGIRVDVKDKSRTGTITLTDGLRSFCLRQNGASWTLLSVA